LFLLHPLITTYQNDAGAANEELAVAALQFLGYSLFDQQLANVLVCTSLIVTLFYIILFFSSQAEVVVPGKSASFNIVVMLNVIVLCELALRPQASSDIITHLLWCLANHKMNCSRSLLTAQVSNLFIVVTHVTSHDAG